MSQEQKKILIIDGHSAAFRAFYALPAESFRNASGQHTNAVYGFLNILLRLVDTEKPDYLAVAFDISRKSFRSEIYPDYKEGRKPTPVEFKGQVPLIQEVLTALGITWIEKENYEADDILATLATQAQSEGMQVLLSSGDRDIIQLVNEQVTLLYPGNRSTEVKRYTPEAVVEKYGVTPALYPHIAALTGEKADNLPGVPGVGEKTAATWINKYGSLEELLNHADEIGGKRGNDLRAHLEGVRRNRELNHLVTDVELPYRPDQLSYGLVQLDKLQEIFDELQFNEGIRKKIVASKFFSADAELLGDAKSAEPNPTVVIQNPQMQSWHGAEELAKWLESAKLKSLAKNPQPLVLSGVGKAVPGHGQLYELVVSSGVEAVFIDLGQISEAELKVVKEFLKEPGKYATESYKPLWHCCMGMGVDLPNPQGDLQLLSYLADPANTDADIATLGERYLQVDDSAVQKIEVEDDGSDLMGLISPNRGLATAQQHQLLSALVEALHDLLKRTGQLPLYTEMELPIQRILAQMEHLGIAVNRSRERQLQVDFATATEAARAEACELVGRPELNLSSPMQLQEVLFDQLGMPKTKKTKRGYTTNAQALEWLYETTEHPFLEQLLAHRDNIKLMQIVDGLIKATDEQGRIHTTFRQNITATGRLSSTEPNLQNIPARSESGLTIREIFVPGEGFDALMSVDYSQIEMRIMAHLSEDEHLIAAINSGEDLHRSMAAMVYGIEPSEVTSEQRSSIKATSYGLAYRLSAFGLSKQLGISVGAAQKLMDKYFERFGTVRSFLDGVVAKARRDGYTETIFGRRRYLPELQSGSAGEQQAAERAALNAPIQGSAADIMKRAMIAVDERLSEQNLKSRVLLQIHDELILELVAEEESAVREIVSSAMAEVADLRVPLAVGIGVGSNWRAAAH